MQNFSSLKSEITLNKYYWMVEIIETSQRSVLPQLIFNTGQENFDISFIIIIIIIIITYLLTAVGLLPGGSG